MNIPNPGPALRTFYTLTEKLERMDRDFAEMRQEVAGLRDENANLTTRLAVLETKVEMMQRTFEAQMRAVVSETVADLRVRYVEAQASAQAENRTPMPPQLP